MTFEELYDYGRKSAPAQAAIPGGLVQSLPRLERINGSVAVQYWYYYQNAAFPLSVDEPLYYAAFDIRENRLVEMKELLEFRTEDMSWLDMVTYDPRMREVKYLEHCAQLLDRGDITEEEIVHAQALWLDAQAINIFPSLYYASGIRPEAVQELISPEMARSSRYLLWIWNAESDKYRSEKAEGYELLDAIWSDPVLTAERSMLRYLRHKGPSKGIRTKSEF